MTAREWFIRATIYATLYQQYEQRGLVANAEWFKGNAVYCVAQGLKMAASDARLK